MALFKNTFIVSSLTLVSRLFGYLRDMLIVAILGASALNDAFIIAFRLPNFFRTIFGEGAFHASFVSTFNQLKAKDQNNAIMFASQIQTILTIALMVLCLIFIIFMPAVISIIAPGYIDNPEVFQTIVNLARIMFPYILLISLMAFYGGILNSFNHFFAFAIAPVILNIVLIITCLISHKLPEKAVYMISQGVIVAGVLELLFMVFCAYRMNIIVPFNKPLLSDEVKMMLKRFIPGVLSSGILQFNILISTVIASFYIGGNSYIYYADRIYQLPLALIGTALGTVILPSLTTHYAKNDKEGANDLLEKSIFLGLLFALPATAGIVYLSYDLVSILFERGEFSKNDALNTAAVLKVFAFGVPGFVGHKILSACFFSLGNTKYPLKIAFITSIINILVIGILITRFGFVAIAYGSVISLYFGIAIMLKKLSANVYFRDELKLNIIKILISTFFMLLMLMTVQYFTNKSHMLIELIAEIVFAMLAYFLSLNMLRVISFQDLQNILITRKK